MTRYKSSPARFSHPFAAIVTCSDSRVIPEVLFSASIGDLFVIRSAGNVVDNCTLCGLKYAVGHLECDLIVVLGHTTCGAVTTAIETVNDIRICIGYEKDPVEASRINVRNSVRLIKEGLDRKNNVRIIGVLYDIRSGAVEFEI